MPTIPNPGEQGSLSTFHSRSMLRGVTVAGAAMLLVGVVLLLVGQTPLGPILLGSGAFMSVGGWLSELFARRHPAPATEAPDYAGPREAGW